MLFAQELLDCWFGVMKCISLNSTLACATDEYISPESLSLVASSAEMVKLADRYFKKTGGNLNK